MKLIIECSVAAVLLSQSTYASINVNSLGGGMTRTALYKSATLCPSYHQNGPSSSSSSFLSIDDWEQGGNGDGMLEASSKTSYGDQDSDFDLCIKDGDHDVRLCSSSALSIPSMNPVTKNLIRGAFLRVASDMTGGTPLENIKCRVTATAESPIKAFRHIVNNGGILNLWSGTESRTVEGALLGAMFLVGSAATKKQVIAMGGSKTMGALAGGVVGGVAQAVVMTPAGLIFTSLNLNKDNPEYENDTAWSVARRVVQEKGPMGLFTGGGPMAARQASNWASRSMFTEICRTNLKMSRFGILGEIGSGAIGGIGSCWNTPIETVRVLMQRDVAEGKNAKTFGQYIDDKMEEGGVQALFRGVTPRAVQAIWQTCFLVVVPNLLGL